MKSEGGDQCSCRAGLMTISGFERPELIASVRCTDRDLVVVLTDGRTVTVHSNWDTVTGKIPTDIYDMLGSPHTLGKWHAGDQFSYAYAVAEGTEMAAYFSVFRQSLAVLSWISHAVNGLAKVGDVKVCRPGTFARA